MTIKYKDIKNLDFFFQLASGTQDKNSKISPEIKVAAKLEIILNHYPWFIKSYVNYKDEVVIMIDSSVKPMPYDWYVDGILINEVVVHRLGEKHDTNI